VEEEAVVVDIIKPLGLVLQATGVAGTEGAERGHLHTLSVPAAHGRDLTLVLVPGPHVLTQERTPCLTLPTLDPAGAGAARVLDL